jgi:hypothetical protein
VTLTTRLDRDSRLRTNGAVNSCNITYDHAVYRENVTFNFSLKRHKPFKIYTDPTRVQDPRITPIPTLHHSIMPFRIRNYDKYNKQNAPSINTSETTPRGFSLSPPTPPPQPPPLRRKWASPHTSLISNCRTQLVSTLLHVSATNCQYYQGAKSTVLHFS